ncbi:MAG: ribulose-phosphate 3-epimerase [Ruminococcaceae bacterium]|nr:ribulose-phosphate 3-epimerase [Oscillospiraceae bacterium]
MDIKVSPSILASDYANLQSELQRISNSDLIHIDVMDGHFVPNITLGAPIVKAIKRVCDIPFDVHLMISNPIDYVEDFASAGADIICFHTESNSDIEKTVDKIISLGKKPALAVKPKTDVDVVIPFLDKLSMVLVMTVEPGFGGQSFMEEVMPKIEKIRSINSEIDIEVDGGINEETVKIAAKAGANVFVAGSAVFKSENPNEMIETLRDNANI